MPLGPAETKLFHVLVTIAEVIHCLALGRVFCPSYVIFSHQVLHVINTTCSLWRSILLGHSWRVVNLLDL